MVIEGDNTYLPPEIIINILKRLPVKSLLRFRCVCKDWRNLLNSPSFIAEHHHHSAHKNPLLIFRAFCSKGRYSYLCSRRYKMETVEVERIPTMDSLRRVSGIIGSCNGLLCVMFCTDDWSLSLFLLNPATRELSQVPRTTNDDCGYGAFSWGFGFSPIVNDYKIVRIHPTICPNNFTVNLPNKWVDTVEMYSLRTGSWKEVVEFGAIQSVKFHSNNVSVNGAIFWLGIGGEYCSGIIVSFDLAMEVFTLIPIPSSTFDSHTYYPRALDVYENKVAMLCGHYAHEYNFIDLLGLEEGSDAYGKSWCWTKKCRIGPISLALNPICFWMNEIACKNCETSEGDSAIHLFKVTTNNVLKRLHKFSSMDNVNGIFKYAESLVSMYNKHIE